MLEKRLVAERLAGVELDPSQSLVSQVFAILKGMIVTLELTPGQLLSETEVADSLGVSKTPVREAIIRLEDMGLVEVVPKSGTYVTPIRLDRYMEACFVRLQLERGAVRHAATRAGFDGIIRLEACIRTQQQVLDAGEFMAFFGHDQAFHRTIFEIADLAGVWTVLHQAQAELDRVRHMKRVFGIRRPEEVIEEHKRIVRTVRERDPDAAEAALVEHIGSLDEEIDQLSAHPRVLESIDQLNAFEVRTRRSHPTARDRKAKGPGRAAQAARHRRG